MKKLCLIAAAILLSTFVYGQENQSKQISVYGKAEIEVPADQASFSFAVNGFGSNLRAAVEQAKNKIKDVSVKLKKIGLKESSFATSYFYSGENFEGKAFLSSTKDYKAAITVIITVDSLQLLEEAILCLSESSVENISSITFSLKKFEAVKEKARLQALENAKKKVRQMAENLNIKLGAVKNCEELDNYYSQIQYGPNPFNSSTNLQRGVMDSDSGFFAKNISISSSIKLVYEIEK